LFILHTHISHKLFSKIIQTVSIRIGAGGEGGAGDGDVCAKPDRIAVKSRYAPLNAVLVLAPLRWPLIGAGRPS